MRGEVLLLLPPLLLLLNLLGVVPPAAGPVAAAGLLLTLLALGVEVGGTEDEAATEAAAWPKGGKVLPNRLLFALPLSRAAAAAGLPRAPKQALNIS